MTASQSDLGKPIRVPFDKIFLDPNNPRLSATEPPGYSDAKRILDSIVQEELTRQLHERENVDELEEVIIAQGWLPVDRVVVWELPKKREHYVVVEGNRRTTALRSVRERLAREEQKLERIRKARGQTASDIAAQDALVERIRGVIAETEQLEVVHLQAKNEAELAVKLPRLLGVRHLNPVRQWSPRAQGLYLLGIYETMFRDAHGATAELEIDMAIVREVAAIVSLGPTKTRRLIQASAAFSHFCLEFEDRLPPGEAFEDDDQYFLLESLNHKYVQEQFGWDNKTMHLPEESAEVLFRWAFSRPRPASTKDENTNVLYKAENFRLWSKMASYDSKHRTNFASRFDVSDPDSAPPMAMVEAEYLMHKTEKKPLEILPALIEALDNLPGHVLRGQASHLRPMLDKVISIASEYRDMTEGKKEK